MFALDTNILIYYFKGVGSVSRYLLSTPPQKIGIPAIVLYELENGIAKSAQPKKRQEALSVLLSMISVLPFDAASAKAASDIRMHLEKDGKMIGPMDLLIAGTALAHSRTLITHNTHEFSRVPRLQILDWY